MNKNKIYELLSEGNVTDAVSTLLEELEGPELDNEAKELENEATEERKPKEDNLEKDNQDVYCDKVHDETEEVKEIVVEDSVVEDILDSNPEAEKAEENFETPEQVAPTASETAEEVEKLLDVNPAEAPKDVELSESMRAIFSILDKINESAQIAAGPELKEPKELENEATEENKPEASVEGKDNQDVYPTDEHKETEEVKEVVVESDQVAAGPELKEPKELENEATEEREPGTMEQNVGNKDVYDAPEHKEVEEVVEVVVEAAKLCSENGVPATLENITKYAKTLFESENIALNVGVPADKEYDADADIESSEMNGNKEAFEKYEDIQGEEASAAKAEESEVESKDLHETVKYTSLREACLLDEDYFVSDSYTVQTADEKQAKLTEQISLLLAREAMDPLYDELLRTSTRAQRLQEACKNKYKAKAEAKAKNIVENNKKKSNLSEESTENFNYDHFEEFDEDVALQEFFKMVVEADSQLNEGKISNFFIKLSIKFLNNKSLDKILASALQKLNANKSKANGGLDPLINKVTAALKSQDKKLKREVIRNFLDEAPEGKVKEAEAKLRKYAATNKKAVLKEADYGYAQDTKYGDTGLGTNASEADLVKTFGTHGDRSGYNSWRESNKLITQGSSNAAVAAAKSGLGATFLGMAGPQAFLVGLLIGIVVAAIALIVTKIIKSKMNNY